MTPLRWGSLVIAFFAVVVLGTVGGVTLVVSNSALAQEDAATYLPPDTQAFLSINVDQDSEQTAKLKAIYQRFAAIPGFHDKLTKESRRGEGEREHGLYIGREDLPWLGPNIALGLISSEGIQDTPQVVGLVSTTDHTATKSFLDETLASQEEVTFVTGTHGGYNSYEVRTADSEETAHLAVTEDYLLFATTQALLEATIDNIASPGESLADNPRFREAQAAVYDPRLAFAYLDVEALMDAQMRAFEGKGASGMPGLGGLLGPGAWGGVPEYLAASVSATDDSIVVFAASPLPDDAPATDWANPLESANRVPADSLAFTSTGGVREDWQQFKERVAASTGRDTSADSLLNLLNQQLDIDIEHDLVAWMSGEIALAMLPPVAPGDGGPILHALLLIEYDDEAAATDGLNTVLTKLAESGPGELAAADLNGVPATLLVVDGLPEGYQPGYVVLNGYAAFGSTTTALEAFIDASNGVVPALAGDPGFVSLRERASGEADTLIYVSANGLVDVMAGAVSPGGLADFAEEAAPFLEPFGGLVLITNTTDTESTIQSIITFD